MQTTIEVQNDGLLLTVKNAERDLTVSASNTIFNQLTSAGFLIGFDPAWAENNSHHNFEDPNQWQDHKHDTLWKLKENIHGQTLQVADNLTLTLSGENLVFKIHTGPLEDQINFKNCLSAIKTANFQARRKIDHDSESLPVRWAFLRHEMAKNPQGAGIIASKTDVPTITDYLNLIVSTNFRFKNPHVVFEPPGENKPLPRFAIHLENLSIEDSVELDRFVSGSLRKIFPRPGCISLVEDEGHATIYISGNPAGLFKELEKNGLKGSAMQTVIRLFQNLEPRTAGV